MLRGRGAVICQRLSSAAEWKMRCCARAGMLSAVRKFWSGSLQTQIKAAINSPIHGTWQLTPANSLCTWELPNEGLWCWDRHMLQNHADLGDPSYSTPDRPLQKHTVSASAFHKVSKSQCWLKVISPYVLFHMPSPLTSVQAFCLTSALKWGQIIIMLLLYTAIICILWVKTIAQCRKDDFPEFKHWILQSWNVKPGLSSTQSVPYCFWTWLAHLGIKTQTENSHNQVPWGTEEFPLSHCKGSRIFSRQTPQFGSPPEVRS